MLVRPGTTLFIYPPYVYAVRHVILEKAVHLPWATHSRAHPPVRGLRHASAWSCSLDMQPGSACGDAYLVLLTFIAFSYTPSITSGTQNIVLITDLVPIDNLAAFVLATWIVQIYTSATHTTVNKLLVSHALFFFLFCFGREHPYPRFVTTRGCISWYPSRGPSGFKFCRGSSRRYWPACLD